MDTSAAFARAIRIAGSECKLAAATGYSQVAINKARRRGSVSPEMALAVHRFTGGAVPASALRPDLWARPQDVPVMTAREPKERAPRGASILESYRACPSRRSSPAQRRTGAAPGPPGR